MTRKTITIDDLIHKQLCKIRAAFIWNGHEISYNTLVNMILLMGLLDQKLQVEERFKNIYKFLMIKDRNLELISPVNEIVEMIGLWITEGTIYNLESESKT